MGRRKLTDAERRMRYVTDMTPPQIEALQDVAELVWSDMRTACLATVMALWARRLIERPNGNPQMWMATELGLAVLAQLGVKVVRRTAGGTTRQREFMERAKAMARQLTGVQWIVLRDAVAGGVPPQRGNKLRTKRALVQRGLLDQDMAITALGVETLVCIRRRAA